MHHDAAALSGLMLAFLRRPEAAPKDAATLGAEGRERHRAVGKVLAETIAAARFGAVQ